MPDTREQQQERSKRRGRAILWSLLALGLLSAADEPALALARETWRRWAPEAGRRLIDAQPVGLESATVADSKGYRWNADLVRYVAPNGKTIKPAAVKQQVATFVERAKAEARTLTARMDAAGILVGEWQQQAASMVRSVHFATYTIGRGGLAQLSPADKLAMVATVRSQLERLQAFALDVGGGGATGDTTLTVPGDLPIYRPGVRLSDKAAESRLPLYMASANGTYEDGSRAGWDGLYRSGVRLQERNVLADDADHCATGPDAIGCADETNRGWVAFGQLSKIGQRQCGPNCMCRIDYRREQR